jgi:hypothetical protein
LRSRPTNISAELVALTADAAAGQVIFRWARVAAREPAFGRKVMVRRYRDSGFADAENCPSPLKKRVEVVVPLTGLAGMLIAN